MGISNRCVWSLPLATGLLVAVVSATHSETLQAEEIIDGGLDISALSVGTLVRNNVGSGEAKGKLVYIDASSADEQHFLDRWINGDLRYPDGSTRNIAERVREDETRRIWNLEAIIDTPNESGEMDTSKVPEAGTYHFAAETMVKDEEFRLRGEAQFELSEGEAGNFLPMIRDDDVHMELTDEGLEMEWPDLDGAQSYHVSVRLDEPRMHTRFVTEDNRHTYAEAESDNIQTLIIRAYSVAPNHDYDGERTTLPIRPETAEPIHASIFQK